LVEIYYINSVMNTNTLHLTQKDFKHIWNHLKASAKKRNIPFTLLPSDIDEIGIPITCPILGIPLYFHRNMVEDDSISFDRIDSTKGYSVDNLIVISYRANKLKSDATLEEMRKIVNFYEKLNSQV
jgi:hypothetical protein